ncbi:MAG: DUF975 family protein [Bacteroidaceae bacterium]|nr:DUF975 family protein [Bacteroidaceae bacterium]
MKSNKEYKKDALSALKGNWTPAVLATIVSFIISLVVSSPSRVCNPVGYGALAPIAMPGYIWVVCGSYFLAFLVFFPFYYVGYFNAFKQLLLTGDDRITSNSFTIGFGNYLHNVFGIFLMVVLICLWTLLFIIPGIVKSYSYALTPYILVEKPELSAMEAINESRRLMEGHKADLFILELSLIGWFFLSLLTLGLGFLWYIPYLISIRASFWEDIKAGDFIWKESVK